MTTRERAGYEVSVDHVTLKVKGPYFTIGRGRRGVTLQGLTNNTDVIVGRRRSHFRRSRFGIH
jgi:hypothetical protein